MSLILKEIAPPLARIWLNRSEKHHAFNAEMMHRFAETVKEIGQTPEVRVVVLSSRGAASFCSGGDAVYFRSLQTAGEVEQMSRLMQQTLRQIAEGPQYYIAAVNGDVLGGGLELMIACHYRIAVSSARFSFRQAANGIITGWGGGRRIMAALGAKRALNLFLSAATLSAAEAKSLGLVDELSSVTQLEEKIRQLTNAIGAVPEAAFRAFMELYLQRNSGNLAEIETGLFVDLWFKKEFREWLENFGRKGERPPASEK